MTDEETVHSTKRLFRKPKKPNLIKLDLGKVKDPISYLEDDSEDSKSQTEKELDNYSTSNDEDNDNDDDTNSGESNQINYTLEYKYTKFPPLIQKLTRDQLIVISEESRSNSRGSASDKGHIVPSNSSVQMRNMKRLLGKSTAANRVKTSSLSHSYHTNSVHRVKPRPRASASSDFMTRSPFKPFKPLGPDPLPSRPVKYHLNDIKTRKAFYDSFGSNADEATRSDAEQDQFDLNDFMLESNYNHRLVNSCVKKISTYNYNQICKMLATQIEEERNKNSNQLHVQTLMPDIEPVINRKPMRQTMIEMANYLKIELSKKTGVPLKTKFNPISKWQRMNGAQAELLIFENQSDKDDSDEETQSSEEITPSKIAVVDSLLRNGLALSLKAHFIDTLPDLTSLKKTLIYINLSFNNFKEFPEVLFEMKQLQVIKLRSNPIRYLPEKVSYFENLKILNLAYCLLNELPACVYELPNLRHLDVSYNRLQTIEDKIIKLTNLKTLNYEGNEIEYLPCSMLNMTNLQSLNVKNNYLHPYIWKKYQSNKIQRLEDLSAVRFCKSFGEESELFFKLSIKVQDLIRTTFTRCDCCGDKRFGEGLSVIKPCVKIFGVKNLPFLFVSCSPECLYSFKKWKK